MQTGALDAAMTDLDTALDYDPYLYKAYIQRGMVLLFKNDPYRAILDFSVAAGLEPLIAEPYAQRALALFANKEYAAAIKDLETALNYDPTNVSARRSLAWMLSVSPDRSLRDGTRALGLVDQQGAQSNQVVYAAVQAESGDIDGAMSTYRTVAGQDPRAGQKFQSYLNAAGYYKGPLDGSFSSLVEEALKQCLLAGCRIGGPIIRP
ncbi:MAG: tetratricopeptide repeat protein [Alphaproteobacteria bacterium]|nr:tetratricopeptide repeat protein [Alphaproteobacteria bacterium]